MQTRTLGKTGHQTSVAVFGAAALMAVDQEEADRAVELVLKSGVTHVDIAPSYGHAEARLAPWTKELIDRGILIGCKTGQRARNEARRELEESLERLGMDRFDLYQLHSVGDLGELDKAMDALEGLIQAQSEGLIKHIGITGHGHESPSTMAEALRRFPFETIMFPVNAKLWSMPDYRRASEEVLDKAEDARVGVLALKTAARRPRGQDQEFHTWYEPFDSADQISKSVRFTLSQKVSGFCTPGDTRILPLALEAAESFEAMDADEQAELIEERAELTSIFG